MARAKRKRAAKRASGRATATRRASGRGARRTTKRGGRRAARRGGGRRGAGKGEKTMIADAAIARATARAQASMRADLDTRDRLADKMAAQAINEAEEIGMLLDEGQSDDEEESEPPEDEAYFLKPALGPPHPRVRPAPNIQTMEPPPVVRRKKGRRTEAVRRPPAARPAAPGPGAKPARPAGRTDGPGGPPPAATAALPGAEHLFTRSLVAKYPVAVRAEGVWVEDSTGRRYLDACSGAVVCSIGHGVKEVADVMGAQARRLAFAHSSQFVTEETMELSRRIAALAPGDMKKTGRVYLVSGGSEAVETAIKLARQYHVECGRPSKHKVVTRWQSYHGSTIGALAATGNVARRSVYTPLLAATPHIAPCYCYRCPYDLTFPKCGIECVDDLERTIRQEGPETVAAFMAEPVVGATLGAVPAVEGYWKRAREICDRYDILLIADEVMTGVGRTGKNFAVDHDKVVPDLIVTGKGLSAGYTPLGAVIARGFIADALRRGRGYFEHGFTYSANPLSAAIGNAVLGYIETHGLVARAARMGKILGERLASLKRHPFVGDVRGRGLLWGVELVQSRATKEPFPPPLKASRRLYDACLEEGLLIYPGSGTREGQDGDHFIVAPPFTVTRQEIDILKERLDRALTATGRALRAAP